MRNEVITIGHGDFKYRIKESWGVLDAAAHPVNDCHEMVMDSKSLIYLLSNETRNNIIIYNKDGNFVDSWGHDYPGGHGLSYSNENGEEFLFITDTERHVVVKTTLAGKVVMELNYPKEITGYTSAQDYLPTETAIAPNGDIYVTDGYGLQFVIQYDYKGNYIRHWGGRGNNNEQFDCMHGIAIDNRGSGPSLLVTSRNHNAFKRFSMDGRYLDTYHMPGSFVCRPVIHSNNVYAAVFRSGSNTNFGSGYVTILNEDNKVVSSPGASAPVYIDGVLKPQQKEGNIFIHPHDVLVDADENLIVAQWKSDKTYPVFLERIS